MFTKHEERSTKPTEADKHKQHATDTDIHKQAHGKTPIPITDLSGGADLTMPEVILAGPHKNAPDVVLMASIGLAMANTELPENARDELLLGEEAVAMRYSQAADMGEQAHRRHSQAPEGLHKQGPEALCAPVVLSALRLLLGVPLGSGSPQVSGGIPAIPCRAWVNDEHIPPLELFCEHVEDVSQGFSKKVLSVLGGRCSGVEYREGEADPRMRRGTEV
jgi:hypothetical protein